jgi:hypothetical protein
VFYTRKIESIDKNFKALDYYLMNLQRKVGISVNFSEASSPMLALVFFSWKHISMIMKTLNKSEKMHQKQAKKLKVLMIRRLWLRWKRTSRKTVKSISSIFRDLEKSLKKTMKTYSPIKKVRFNV